MKLVLAFCCVLLTAFLLTSCAGKTEVKSTEEESKREISRAEVGIDDVAVVVASSESANKIFLLTTVGYVKKDIDLGDQKVEAVWQNPSKDLALAKIGFNRWYLINAKGQKQVKVPVEEIGDIRQDATLSTTGDKFAFAYHYEPSSSKKDGSLNVVNLGAGQIVKLAQPKVISGLEKLVGIRHPAFSPDGTKIAYDDLESYQADNLPVPQGRRISSLWVADISQQRLLHLTSNGEKPVWSPKGDKIAYVSYRAYQDENGNSLLYPEIHVVSADGKIDLRIAEKADNPAWSADGRMISYSTSGPMSYNEPGLLYIVNSDGNNPTLVSNKATASYWSSHSNRLVFLSPTKEEGRRYYVSYLYYPQGDYKQELGTDINPELPIFSPEGSQIIFPALVRDSEGKLTDKRGLFIANQDGKQVRRIDEQIDFDKLITFGWGR